MPNKWQSSDTEQIGKLNGKLGCAAIRLINKLCPARKAFFKILWERARPKKAIFAYGFYAHRRREQAILVQNVTA